MKKMPVLVLALTAATVFAEPSEPKEAPYSFKLDFETPVKRGFAPNSKNKIFLAPSKNLLPDQSGAKAYSGKGAIGIKAGENLTMDASIAKPRKTNTMTVWAKAEKPGTGAAIRFVWFRGRGAFRTDANNTRLFNTEWTKLTKTVKAPEKSGHVYFILSGGSKDAAVWFDDFSITEE